LGVFVYIGALVTAISGGGGEAVAAEGVNPEAGEAIYWGKGKCSTCHSLGERGSAVRGPNHGNVCGKARDERVAERQAAGAAHIQTATDFLVESIAQPNAYVVEGFAGQMPEVYLPPISLSADEIRAVITYLQTQGCEPDPTAINLPSEILNAASIGVSASGPFSLIVTGDPAAGQTLFSDAEGTAACIKCHTVAGEGEEVGPELTGVAGTQTLEYVYESIVDPSAQIAAGGYEPIQVQVADGTILSGIIKNEDEATLTIKDKESVETVVSKSDINREKRYPDVPSIMPDNFGELLTIKQVADLIAFLQQSAGVLPAEQ
jgi:putative heme-binding domain-containing protein